MAMVSWSGVGRSWILLIFGLFSIVFSHPKDDYYRYEVDFEHQPTYQFNFWNEDETFRRQKRQFLAPNITSTTSHPNITETDFTKKPKSNKTVEIGSKAKGSLDRNYSRLLGVNGSGQWKMISTSVPTPTLLPSSSASSILNNKKPLYSEPVTNNNASSTKTNKKYQNEEDDDIPISKFTMDVDVNETFINQTLTKHELKVQTDTHEYYNSTLNTDGAMGHHFWVDLANRSDAKVSELLINSHRRAATVKLPFLFPFYGNLIKNVTIATGGFLYTGEYVHSWLAATQYIAPLMANFDTSISNDSYIKHVENGTSFTVQWNRVSLQDKPEAGEFTFQATLHKNGDIVFVYQNIPIQIGTIQDDNHPVKVGLSDAYIIDRTIFFVRRKTIYEYHRVNFPKQNIRNWTTIYLKALPTCLEGRQCAECLAQDISKLKCMWCPASGRCSNGFDRNRQEWLNKNCDKNNVGNESMCNAHQYINGGSTVLHGRDDESNHFHNYEHDGSDEDMDDLNGLHRHHFGDHDNASNDNRVYNEAVRSKKPVRMGVSGIVTVLFLVGMAGGLAMWIMYAYRNPHTTSGQILIRYRPTQWHWRRGEARYTAATIHM